MKKWILISFASILYIIAFMLTSGVEHAHTYSSQPPPFNASAPGQGSCGAGGGGCHSSFSLNEGTGSVAIDFNAGSTMYQANQTYTINVTVSQMGATRFGFQLVALDDAGNNAGSFTITNSTNTAKQSSGGIEFVNHNNAPFASDSQTFTFDWTAPNTGFGNVNFYVSGNAANGMGAIGDYIYSKQLSIIEDVPTTAGNFSISAKVYLEAMYDGTSMTTARNTDGLLPNMQPFATYYNYNGTEMASSFPTDVVDWVLISLKDASEMVVAQKAGFIMADGSLADEMGNTNIEFAGIADTEMLTLLVHHQSHLGVASANMLASGSMYDFTTMQTQAAGVEQLKLVNGSYAMYSGDYDGNGNINNLDFNLWANNSAAVNQYLNYDADGNGIVNNLDYNSWELNRSKVADLLTALP